MSTRQPLIAGNWKMHHTIAQALAYFASLRQLLSTAGRAQVWLFPPATALAALRDATAGHWLRLGAQNLHESDEGAYTGELAASMLREAGAVGVLIGHSERRHLFGESDDRIAAKVAQAQRHGLTPFLCVGETRSQREAGEAEAVVRTQLEQGLRDADPTKVVIAYEPVWAIGTGLTATPAEAQAMHQVVRTALGDTAADTQILYGGSVKPDNATELLSQPDVDGLLVGGASLNPADFAAIVAAAA